MSATIESSPFTRWVVLAALSLATVVIFAVSMRGNFLYGYSIGQSEEKRWLFGCANVAADVWKAFGLIAVTLLWRARQRRTALLASLAWLVCLLFGLNSALGIYVQDRVTLIGARAATHATYQEVESELADVEGQRRRRGEVRSVLEIEAAINGVLARPIVTGRRVRGTVATVSRTCTRIDARTKDACQELARLREQRAAAHERDKLQARARVLRRQIVTLRDRGGTVAPDPLGELYAWLTAGFVSVRDVGFGFPLFFALLIEVVSTFGPVTIAGYAEASRSRGTDSKVGGGVAELAMAGRDEVWPAGAGAGEQLEAHVLAWLAERAVPTSGNKAIGISALYQDYAEWCAEAASRAASISLFEDEFDRVRGLPDLAGKIRKFGDRYYGVALVRRGRRALSAKRGRCESSN